MGGGDQDVGLAQETGQRRLSAGGLQGVADGDRT